jgi:hypothetical protein
LGERCVELDEGNVVVVGGVGVELVDNNATGVGVEFGDVLYICGSQQNVNI